MTTIDESSFAKDLSVDSDFTTPLRPSYSNVFPEDFKKIGILEVIANDPRPSFVLDLDDIQVNGWRTTYTNDACLSALSDALVLRDDDGAGPFREWASGTDDAKRSSQYRHNGKLWTSFDLRDRWRIVSGTRLECPPEALSGTIDSKATTINNSSSGASVASSWVRLSSRSSSLIAENPVEEPNWADHLPRTPFIDDVFKPHDWSKSPLGPLANWPYVLRRSTRFVLADPNASCIFWGDKQCCVYNSGYAEVMLSKQRSHGLGQPAAIVWPELYDRLVPIFAEALATRQSSGWNNIQFFLEKDGSLIETYWNWTLIPLVEDYGVGTGLYSSVTETTQQYLHARRQDSFFRSIHARDTWTFWEKLQENFSKNTWDVPFASFYEIQRPRRLSQDSDSKDRPQRCMLRGTIGVPNGHAAFPASSDLSTNASGILSFLAEAATNRESLILTNESHPTFFKLLDGLQWAGHGRPSNTIVISCLRLGDEILGFVVLGLNPLRPYNEDEHRFVDMLDNHLSASISSAALIERSQENEVRLQRRLAQSIEQTEMSDARYRAITELSPLGMINVSTDGSTLYANRMWFEITGHPSEADYSRVSFRNIIHEDDLELIDEEFSKMVDNKERRFYELRLNKKIFDQHSHRWHDRWILCTGGPEYDDDGDVRSIIGCITEITSQKLAESVQAQSRQAAEEAKAAQEKFMDATSHEMRNPLSAILQSADDIIASLRSPDRKDGGPIVINRDAYDQCIEAANVIALCAQHQTRIVDDVLTMSKLNSHMLEVTPIPAEPVNVVRETMQMYSGELHSNKIKSEIVIQASYADCGIEWVFCDPARLKQILINLISNAVKFTRQTPNRKITATVTASLMKPPKPEIGNDIVWCPSSAASGHMAQDLTDEPAWGNGEIVYIGIMVADTGTGLSDQEREKLFNRFSQANTLTHVHYGGSGLGLFICRELTEMQGGEIGVASQPGGGSAFAFYIKCRRAPSRRPSLPIRSLSGHNVAQMAAIVQSRSTSGDGNDFPKVKETVLTSKVPSTPPHSLSRRPSTVSPSLGATLPKAAPCLHVLVVEDNLVNQRIMVKQLTKAGCIVAVANHGREALEYLEKTCIWSPTPRSNNYSTIDDIATTTMATNLPADANGSKGTFSPGSPLSPLSPLSSPPPTLSVSDLDTSNIPANIDIAFVDIEMPVMNGLECARRIRELQVARVISRHLPLMAVTANARREQIADCLSAGMDDVTIKPFKMLDLLAKARKLVERCRDEFAAMETIPETSAEDTTTAPAEETRQQS